MNKCYKCYEEIPFNNMKMLCYDCDEFYISENDRQENKMTEQEQWELEQFLNLEIDLAYERSVDK